MTLDAAIRFRCEKSLVKRLKTIANRQKRKHLAMAREELEKFVLREEEKQAQRDRLEKKAA